MLLVSAAILSACQIVQAPYQPATNWTQFQENCAAQHGAPAACACLTNSLSNSIGFQQYQALALGWAQKLQASPVPTKPADGTVRRTGIPLDRPQEQPQNPDDPFLRLNAQAAKACQTTILNAMGWQ
ncbi:hypothetical protein E6C67_14350 [Azospirillum sp. TSA2s]|uniref:hypothetical protein n=1 Tax=Azospirillum sp. TSA2s TaxID=709810 RepID=UPI0010AA4080|nr:hypothetical protein [Azospirillum sp. TSA2s]QCG95007.1 hypothetical protein E6C67_14350 [Azospirillum sp. TSA2s]